MPRRLIWTLAITSVAVFMVTLDNLVVSTAIPPLFQFNPSISFLIRCEDAHEVDTIWEKISEGGEALMPLDEYPFSKRYGWVQDRFGLSWQIMLSDEPGQRLIPALMYTGDVAGKADEAIEHYTSVFPDSAVSFATRYGAGEEPNAEGTLKYGVFTLFGQELAAMDSAYEHGFTFNEAVSLMVYCDSQQEIDRYWERLSAFPENEQCGWLKDKFGVSWQIVPRRMDEMLTEGTKEQIARVTEAFLPMKKFDVAALERAYAGS
jgi:predicted 3-demethylubiquinone-9 3-methyltransferase (glyoxalase superfamily)